MAVKHEEELGVDRPETLRQFGQRIATVKQEFAALLERLKNEGAHIAGYGAPAKTTTLMYHFGIDAELIDYIVDDNPLKQGMLTPGLHIPVLPPSAIYEQKPDYVVVLAWNFAPSIMERHAAYQEGGGHFITVLPEVSVH